MTKKSRLPQSPRHVLLFDEDWQYLETHFGPTGFKPIGVSAIIRAIIHTKILSWREVENRAFTEAMREKHADTADISSPAGSSA